GMIRIGAKSAWWPVSAADSFESEFIYITESKISPLLALRPTGSRQLSGSRVMSESCPCLPAASCPPAAGFASAFTALHRRSCARGPGGAKDGRQAGAVAAGYLR